MPVQPATNAEGDGLTIILSPVQLAALLDGRSITSGETLNNRLWGAVTVIGGAIELVGSAALLLAPDPTMVTKVGGFALAVHGSDTMGTGLRQLWFGRPQTTLTAQAAAAACRSMGCDPATAGRFGTAIDIIVPVAAAGAAGAARALAVRQGTIDLWEEERAGGHTIRDHIGKAEAELRARLAQKPRMQIASSFRNLEEAEALVSEALRRNAAAIREWAKFAQAGDTRAFIYQAGKTAGYGVVRSTGKMQPMNGVRVVLEKARLGNKIYFVLTAYATP